MAEDAELQRDVDDLDAQIVELRQYIDGLRTQLRSDGAQDAEDIAASLTNIEENEGALNALEQRRERLRSRLGQS